MHKYRLCMFYVEMSSAFFNKAYDFTYSQFDTKIINNGRSSENNYSNCAPWEFIQENIRTATAGSFPEGRSVFPVEKRDLTRC